ncbi:hypothetical protein [uncultured Mediterranean phage uvDeep-CGR2-AD10-C281]|jgi:hypothetical protein|nr:hypothetical protein [uncultured Mediterranean phage uvDeep-CGR2-AD10-C281]
MFKKKTKKSWASSKRQRMVRTVGNCLHCAKEITNDMSFIIYATHKPAHHSCYKIETEKEQNAKSR